MPNELGSIWTYFLCFHLAVIYIMSKQLPGRMLSVINFEFQVHKVPLLCALFEYTAVHASLKVLYQLLQSKTGNLHLDIDESKT